MSLEENKLLFDWALSRVEEHSGNTPMCMAWANIAATIACNLHTGQYWSHELECVLNNAGNNLKSINSIKIDYKIKTNKNKKVWLHVLTIAMPVGGHTRLVERLILNRICVSDDIHSVLIIDQGTSKFPDWLIKAVVSSGGECYVLPDCLNLEERAIYLKKIASDSADVVILHTHPYDSVPLVAFANEDGPPVVFMNHADHVFWLGCTVSDLVSEIRIAGQNLSLSRRNINKSIILPIPLQLKTSSKSRASYKNDLGISSGTVLILSIGTASKYKPYQSYNFQSAMLGIIQNNNDALLIIIGPTSNEIEWEEFISQASGRIKVLGVVDDLSKYYGAADIYVEGFPLGSLTASLDAALLGVPIVRAPTPLLPVFGIDRYNGMDENSTSILEFQKLVSLYISDSRYRNSRGIEQQNAVVEMHIGTGWNKYFDDLILEIPPVHKSGKSNWPKSNSCHFLEDAIWASVQESQSAAPGLAFRVTCTALRMNLRYISKKWMFKNSPKYLYKWKFVFNKMSLIEFSKLIITLLTPRPIYHKLIKKL